MTPLGEPWPHTSGASLREAIRLRPGMYVGDVLNGSGVMSLLCEVVDNVVDLHYAGECTRADVRLLSDGSLSVSDDGPGMPIEEHLGVRSFLEAVFVDFHGHSMRRSAGQRLPERPMLFGLGLSPVNHFASWVEVEVCRGGARYRQRFVDGVATQRLSCEGPTQRSGTTVKFQPDPAIFSRQRPSFKQVVDYLQSQVILAPGLVLTAYDESSSASRQFYAPEGIVASVVQRLGDPRETLPRGPIFQVQGESGDISVQVAIGWSSAPVCSVESFANLRKTTDGTHVDGLISGVSEAFDRLDVYREGGLAGRPRGMNHPVLRGLVAVVAVRSRSATFFGATRERLASSEIADVVHQIVLEPLRAFLQSQPALVRALLSDKNNPASTRSSLQENRYSGGAGSGS